MIKRIVYAVLLALTVYLAIIYSSTSLIFLAGVEIFLPLFLFMILMAFVISLDISFDKKQYYVEPEKRAHVALKMKNKIRIPNHRITIRLKLENITTNHGKKLCMRTAPDRRSSSGAITQKFQLQGKEMQLELPELSAGIWSMECKKIRIYDLLDWFSVGKWKPLTAEIIQMPKKYEVNLRKALPEADSPLESEEYEIGIKGSDPSHVREIREYQPGDRLSAIHWKLSAKKQQLMVKEYGQPVGCGLLFGLDADGLTENLLELIYSLLAGCVKQRCKLMMVWKQQKAMQHDAVEYHDIQTEEDVFSAMESLMRSNLCSWNTEVPELSGRQLWLKEQRLFLDEVEIQDFSGKDLKETLLDTEVVL